MGIPHMSLERIKSATLNFSEEREISSGGFGSVFAGTFENGQIWAVKRAKEASSQSSKFFEREVRWFSCDSEKLYCLIMFTPFASLFSWRIVPLCPTQTLSNLKGFAWTRERKFWFMNLWQWGV